MKPTPQEVKIHIQMIDDQTYEWWSEGGDLKTDGLHVGDEDHVVFIADGDCEVRFVPPHYFTDPKKKLQANAAQPANLKRLPQGTPRQMSHWEAWAMVHGRMRKLDAVAHVHAASTRVPMNYSGMMAETAVMVRGEPDPVIQP